MLRSEKNQRKLLNDKNYVEKFDQINSHILQNTEFFEKGRKKIITLNRENDLLTILPNIRFTSEQVATSEILFTRYGKLFFNPEHSFTKK